MHTCFCARKVAQLVEPFIHDVSSAKPPFNLTELVTISALVFKRQSGTKWRAVDWILKHLLCDRQMLEAMFPDHWNQPAKGYQRALLPGLNLCLMRWDLSVH